MILALLGCSGAHLQTRTGYGPDSEPTSVTSTTGQTGDSSTSSTSDSATAPPRLFAYVGAGDGQVYGYTLADGALSPIGAWPVGTNPSFLAFSPDRRFGYAVDEGADQLVAFAIDPESGGLSVLNQVPSNGAGPAFLTVDATGGHVLAANYGGGTVTSVAVLGDGSLGAAVSTLATGANAHQIVLDPANRFAFVPNLGSDSVSQLVFDPVAGTLAPNAVPSIPLPAGAGPRHLAFHPTAPFAYLIDETDDTMVALAYDAELGRLTPIQTLSTLPAGADGAGSYCAEVAFGAGGRFLYGSNRGDDSLVIFAVDPVTGLLSLVGHQPTDGDWPRHFSLTPAGDLLLVGNQRSDEVVLFAVDPVDGTLTLGATTTVPGPAYVGLVAR